MFLLKNYRMFSLKTEFSGFNGDITTTAVKSKYAKNILCVYLLQFFRLPSL